MRRRDSLLLRDIRPEIRRINEACHLVREGVRGVAMATPIFQVLFHKIVVLKWPKTPKTLIFQMSKGPKIQKPKGPKAQRSECPN